MATRRHCTVLVTTTHGLPLPFILELGQTFKQLCLESDLLNIFLLSSTVAPMRQQLDGAVDPSLQETAPARAVAYVLGTPELLRAIFDVFKPDLSTEEDFGEDYARRGAQRAALAACARVSHHFSKHALDVLWSCIDAFIHVLFNFLPSSIKIVADQWVGLILLVLSLDRML